MYRPAIMWGDSLAPGIPSRQPPRRTMRCRTPPSPDRLSCMWCSDPHLGWQAAIRAGCRSEHTMLDRLQAPRRAARTILWGADDCGTGGAPRVDAAASLLLSDVVSRGSLHRATARHRSSGGCSEECLVATTVFAKGKVVVTRSFSALPPICLHAMIFL